MFDEDNLEDFFFELGGEEFLRDKVGGIRVVDGSEVTSTTSTSIVASTRPSSPNSLEDEYLSEFIALQLREVRNIFEDEEEVEGGGEGEGDVENFLSYFNSNNIQEILSLSSSPSPPPQNISDRHRKLLRLLTLNRKYQQVLREQLVMVTESERKIRELERGLKVMVAQIIKKRRKKSCGGSGSGGGITGPLVLIDSKGKFPPDNEDTLKIGNVVNSYMIACRPFMKWNEKEQRLLARGIRHENISLLIDKLVHRPSINPSSTTNTLPSYSYEDAINYIQGLSDQELEGGNLEGINWNKISKIFVKSRSPDDCRIQWACVQHPSINNEPFTEEEKRRLMDIVTVEGIKGKWVSIAEALGSDRTAWQCLAAYRSIIRKKTSSASNNTLNGKWSPSEDRQLMKAVAIYGEFDCWPQISEVFENRTVSQCIHRWFKNLNPRKKNGRWTAEEDGWLLGAINLMGTSNWSTLCRFVPLRTDVQCRERYMNVLAPNIDRDEFTKEEEELLREAVERHGEGHWSAIASEFPNRTDSQCRRQWFKIKASRRRGRGRPTRRRNAKRSKKTTK